MITRCSQRDIPQYGLSSQIYTVCCEATQDGWIRHFISARLDARTAACVQQLSQGVVEQVLFVRRTATRSDFVAARGPPNQRENNRKSLHFSGNTKLCNSVLYFYGYICEQPRLGETGQL